MKKHGQRPLNWIDGMSMEYIMVLAVAQTEQQTDNGIDLQRPSTIEARDAAKLDCIAKPEPSRLQAAHASKHGVILKGTRHQTFWEW